nr:MAG TPA: RuvC [Caudoviricetes sp.]
MSLKNILNKKSWSRLIAIDPASHSLAWCVIDSDKNVLATGKIILSSTRDQSDKFKLIKKELIDVINKYTPDAAVIEQSVYIQNFQTSRVISYIIGFSWGVMSDKCDSIQDVNPLVWKSAIGYKNVTKKDQEVLKNNGKKGSLPIKAKNERKQRVREIVSVAYGSDTPGLEDDDIIDALGIALWYYKTGGKNGS